MKMFEETYNADYITVTAVDPEFDKILDKIKDIPDDVSQVSKVEYVEDNPANEGGDVSFLFNKIFGRDSYIEAYFVYDTRYDLVESATDIAGVWDLTSDSKNPNTYYAAYIGSSIYVATVVEGHTYLIGALNKEEYDEVMEELPENISIERFIARDGDIFVKTFVKSAAGLD